MHPLGQQNGYGGYGLEGAGQQQPTSPHTNGTEADEGSKYSDINSILDQILNITDQSLDEAQVLYYLSYELQQDCLVLALINYRSSTLFLLLPKASVLPNRYFFRQNNAKLAKTNKNVNIHNRKHIFSIHFF